MENEKAYDPDKTDIIAAIVHDGFIWRATHFFRNMLTIDWSKDPYSLPAWPDGAHCKCGCDDDKVG
jgi:hypothetical protein